MRDDSGMNRAGPRWHEPAQTIFEEKQRGILISAAAVFAEMGMEKASMAMIASHSNVSKALLYHYYPSKDALIFDIVRTHLKELDAAIDAADQPDAPPETRLRLLVRHVLENYRDADNQHKVQLNASGTLSAEQLAETAVQSSDASSIASRP